jgi:predicted PurR-regulated permease PerM
MLFTSIVPPLLMITMCILVGLFLGVVFMLVATTREINSLHDEVESYRKSNERLIKRWKNKYVDDGTHEY